VLPSPSPTPGEMPPVLGFTAIAVTLKLKKVKRNRNFLTVTFF
jgi:hypothetical protein